MKKVCTYTLALVAAFVLSECKPLKNAQTSSKGDLVQKKFKTEIPFERASQLIKINVGLNSSKEKHDFIFDTGAGTTVVSKKLADLLGLKKISDITVKDALGNASQQDIVNIDSLDINGHKFYNINAVVVEFGKYSPVNCLGTDGIIGANVLSKCNWTVDYQRKILTATDTDLVFHQPSVSLPFNSAVPHIDIQIGGATIKDVIVDLGSNESVTLPSSVLDQTPGLKISNMAYRKIDGMAEGLNGTHMDTVWMYSSDNIKLGSQIYSHISVSQSRNYLAKVGADFWDKNLIGLDYKNHKLLVSKNSDEPQKNYLKGYGFKVANRDGKYIISLLVDNSPAADAGLKIGDEVLELNNQPVATLFSDYCEGLSWQTGHMDEETQLTVKMLKNNKEYLKLKNADYRPATK